MTTVSSQKQQVALLSQRGRAITTATAETETAAHHITILCWEKGTDNYVIIT